MSMSVSAVAARERLQLLRWGAATAMRATDRRETPVEEAALGKGTWSRRKAYLKVHEQNGDLEVPGRGRMHI